MRKSPRSSPKRRRVASGRGARPGGCVSLVGWAGQIAGAERSAAPAKGERSMQADAEPLAPGDAMSLSDSALRAVTGSRSDVVARLATDPRFDSRTRLLLEGPIVATL